MDPFSPDSLIVPRIILLVVDLYGLMALQQVLRERPDEAQITARTVILVMSSALVLAALFLVLPVVATQL